MDNENLAKELGEQDDTTADNVIPFRKGGLSILPELAITLSQAKERIEMLQQFVKEMMVKGVDYGYVPGCEKPSLFKAGAEKLCDIFGFSKHIEVINRVEDWQKGFIHYEVKAVLICKRTGLVETEGLGSCNSKEKKYRFQDAFTLANTMLKMAKKRALVDSVLSATRSSGIFTQDIEDLGLDFQKQAKKPVNKKQLTEIFALVSEKQIAISEMKLLLKEKYNVNESKYLTSSQAENLISYLKGLEYQEKQESYLH
jgi:hypothetical protein